MTSTLKMLAQLAEQDDELPIDTTDVTAEFPAAPCLAPSEDMQLILQNILGMTESEKNTPMD